MAAAAESGFASLPAPSATQRTVDLLLWRNPVLTALVFGAGVGVLTALEILMRRNHQITLLSGEQILTIGTSLDFLESSISDEGHEDEICSAIDLAS